MSAKKRGRDSDTGDTGSAVASAEGALSSGFAPIRLSAGGTLFTTTRSVFHTPRLSCSHPHAACFTLPLPPTLAHSHAHSRVHAHRYHAGVITCHLMTYYLAINVPPVYAQLLRDKEQ